MKGWKTRYFCARNQADNYAIDYYETESGAKKKGTIQCCGHRTEEFSAEEEELHGKHGIKISPEDDDSRIWWLRCESEDDKADWAKLFMNACQKALPPVHPDLVVVAAFRGAHRALRARYGYRGWYRSSYTEAELLARLCSDIIAKEVTHEVFSDTASEGSSQKAAAVKSVQKSVNAAVLAAASKAWASTLASCLPLRDPLEAQVRGSLQELRAQEAQLAEAVLVLGKEPAELFLRRSQQRMCASVLRSCEHPVTNAFVTSIHGLSDYMSEQIREGTFARECFQASMVASHRSVEDWWSGPLEDANQVCWAMYTDDLTDISAYFVAGYSAYNLYSEVLDACRRLAHQALSMFSRLAEQSDYLNLELILKRVLFMVIHDAKVCLREVLHNILVGLLQSAFEAEVVAPCVRQARPLQSVVDAAPASVAGLLSVRACCESALWALLHQEVAALVQASHADNCAEIDTTIDQLGAVRE